MDSEAKKLFAGDTWAVDGQRMDVESTNIPHPISRRNGFQADYSEDANIIREIINQIFCEMVSACKELLYGISPWDADVTYPAGAFTQVNGAIYNSVSETRGANPLSQNQAAWILIGNRVEDPVSVPHTIASSSVFVDGSRSDRFRVFWEPPDDGGREITGARLRYSKTSDFSSGVTTINDYGQGSDISVSGNDSDTYYIRLRFTNIIGDSNESASIDVRSTPLTPPAITGITATTGAASGRVDVSWSPVNPSNGLTISKYRIEWKSGTQSFSSSASPARHQETTSTNATITGLTDGTLYTFRVIPVSNRNTENTGTATTAGAPTPSSQVPSKPTISATGGPQIIYVSATNVPDHNGSSITSYEWQYKLSSDSEWTDAASTTAPVTTITTTTAGTYNIQMRAVNGVGNGEWSDSVDATVTTTTAPSDIAAHIVSGGPGNVVASIGEDTDDGGSAITGYVWAYKLSTDSDWTSAASSTNPTRAFTGLTKGSVYNFRVSATNGVGTTTSDAVNFTVENDVFAAPSDLTASLASGGPGKVVASIGEDTDDGGSAITGYVWAYKLSTDSDWTSAASSTNPTRAFTGLTKGSVYNFRVSATNGVGTTTSDAVNFTVEEDASTPPTKPGIYNAVDLLSDINLNYPNTTQSAFCIKTTDTTINTKNGNITDYEWQMQLPQNNEYQNDTNIYTISKTDSTNIGSTGLELQITNIGIFIGVTKVNCLLNNVASTQILGWTGTYKFRLRLKNTHGWSEFSDWISLSATDIR